MREELLAAGVDPFLLAADMLDPPGGGVVEFYDDPVGFVRECVRWGEGDGPTDYQRRVLGMLVERERVCVRGPHSLGKTALNSWLVLWFALTRDARGVDWKVVTTASAWRQLEKYLWPEVRKWSMRLRWGRIGRAPFSSLEMMRLGLRLTHGEAIAVACEDPATIEGAHADSLLYLYDESKTIPAETFDASEGAFMGAGAETEQEALAIATSTPGVPAGRFFEIQEQRAGMEDWAAVRVTKDEVIRAGRMSASRAEARRRQWGEDSAMYQNRVEGNFAVSEADGVIPLSWVEAAVERWLALRDGGFVDLGGLTSIGVDVAEEGGDRTVLALRYGSVVRELRRLPRGDVMVTTGHVAGVLSRAEHRPPAIVDAIGLGAGVIARLREQEFNAVAFKASEKSALRDRSGELEMANCRAAAWWMMRELLDPANGSDVALPDDEGLVSELTVPHCAPNSSGRMLVEAKSDIRKRLGRSTDSADAVIQAFWSTAHGSVRAPSFGVKAARYPRESVTSLHGGRWV